MVNIEFGSIVKKSSVEFVVFSSGGFMNSLKSVGILGASLALCALVSVPAYAERRLKEPKTVRKAGSAGSSELKKALGEELYKTCNGNMKKTDLTGIRCRLKVFNERTSRPMKSLKARDVKKQVKAAKSAIKAGKSIAAYKPIKKKPGHREKKYRAHKEACAVALGVYDRFERLDSTPLSPKVKKMIVDSLGGKKGIARQACECARDTVVLAQTLDLPADERGGLQGALTSRGCFLDKSKIAAGRGGPKSQFLGKTANDVVKKNSAEGMMLEFVKTRDVELNRCRDKWFAPGKVKDKAKAEKCFCRQMARWKFPKERGRKDMTVALPLNKNYKVDVLIAANGKNKACGNFGPASSGAGTLVDPATLPKEEVKTDGGEKTEIVTPKAKKIATEAKKKLKK